LHRRHPLPLQDSPTAKRHATDVDSWVISPAVALRESNAMKIFQRSFSVLGKIKQTKYIVHSMANEFFK
jgi:hypothetical protein